MSKKRSAGAERLRRARKAASKELRLPLGSWQTRRYGLLMVAHDNITTRLANGGDVSIADLLRIDEAMAAIRASLPPEPVGVTIEIVDSLPQLPSPDPPSTPPPTPPTPPTETKPSPPAPLPAAASNVVELPRRGGSIHDAVLPYGTPARMARSELWPASDPVPDWGAAHSLPPIPPECFRQ